MTSSSATNTFLEEEANGNNKDEHLPHQQQIKPSSFGLENILREDNTSSLLPKAKKTLIEIEKPESIGVLSNDKESITSVYPPDQTVSSVSQAVEDRQSRAQGRRLLDDTTFAAKCTQGYVDCVRGSVNGNPSITCATACGGKCCTRELEYACDGFTGKGKQRIILV